MDARMARTIGVYLRKLAQGPAFSPGANKALDRVLPHTLPRTIFSPLAERDQARFHGQSNNSPQTLRFSSPSALAFAQPLMPGQKPEHLLALDNDPAWRNQWPGGKGISLSSTDVPMKSKWMQSSAEMALSNPQDHYIDRAVGPLKVVSPAAKPNGLMNITGGSHIRPGDSTPAYGSELFADPKPNLKPNPFQSLLQDPGGAGLRFLEDRSVNVPSAPGVPIGARP